MPEIGVHPVAPIRMPDRDGVAGAIKATSYAASLPSEHRPPEQEPDFTIRREADAPFGIFILEFHVVDIPAHWANAPEGHIFHGPLGRKLLDDRRQADLNLR